MVSNILDSVTIKKNGSEHSYDLSHLKDISFNIAIESDSPKNVTINVLPTNHVYSIGFKNTGNKSELTQSGYLLNSYKHCEKDISKLDLRNGIPEKKEIRVFDEERYNQSYYLPDFINSLIKDYKKKCILANSGDDKQCLSGLFSTPSEDFAYLVIFKLKKVKALEINMIIETAYVEKIDSDHRLEKISSPKNRGEINKLRPFATLVINVLAGRNPFEGRPNDKRNRRKKAKKSKKSKEIKAHI